MAKRKFKGFFGHGNKNSNPKPHHLYEIRDKLDSSLYKYGISAELIEENGYSSRMRRQVDIGNSFVGWQRFYAKILIRNIPGRENARIIEQQFIDAYVEKFGELPRGNFE